MRNTMKTRRKLGHNKAFTLIELLVVILILAVLAAMIVPRIIQRTGQAKSAAAKSDLSTLGRLLETFRLDVGRYPSTEEGLDALRNAPSEAANWQGPYTNKPVPNDPWTNPYFYEYPGADGDESYILLSYGSDGIEGGEGEALDIIESGE